MATRTSAGGCRPGACVLMGPQSVGSTGDLALERVVLGSLETSPIS